MTDSKARLLPPRSVTQTSGTRPGNLYRHPMDLSGLKKRGHVVRSWIRIDSYGNSQVMELDKTKLMKRCDLPARDLRLLDPLFESPSIILGREKAIVVNLEQIRCIITADEVLLLNSLDSYVEQYREELQRRLAVKHDVMGQGLKRRASTYTNIYGNDPSSSSSITGFSRQRLLHEGDLAFAEYLPFELKALEVALEAACKFLDSQAMELEVEAYPVLDELTSKVSTLNLERVRRLKSRLLALTYRVQKVRDEVAQLMDDDGDMAEMYLTEKKERNEILAQRDQAQLSSASFGAGSSLSAPVSPVRSPTDTKRLEKTFSLALSHAKSRHSSTWSSEDGSTNIEELEMLLEAYFVVIEGTRNKLTALKEYIDDTEDFINIQLDNVRNQLIQVELLLTTGTFVVAIFGVIAGVFGMNIEIGLFEQPSAFKWVLVVSGFGGLLLFFAFCTIFKWKGLMPL